MTVRRATAVSAALAGLLVITACSTGSTQSGAGGAVGQTLTVVTVAAPQSLDPGKAQQNDAWFDQLAYEPLIVRKSDGSLRPGLATSWSYRGTDNKTFVLHLRQGVKFSDGSALTAQTVVDDFAYVEKAHGQLAPFLIGDTFTATDPHTVTITTAAPNPNFPVLLTQDYIVGGIISPKGLASPAQLGTRTLGAGPYLLDASQTVTGDHYTYVPNPNYFDPKSVHWHKVVVKVITNAQSVLNALRSGQAQVSVGDPSTLTAARRDGLTVASAPLLWNGVTLADRGGTVARPLADIRVRQALNYATNRSVIAGALFTGNGKPVSQVTVPGGYGYDPATANSYPYDPNKARQLLNQAGYPDGFTMKLVTSDFQQMNLLAQALEQQWKTVGVRLRVTDDANPNQYVSDAFSGKFPAFSTAFGQLPLWMEGPSLFLPTAAYNPFHTKDTALQSLYDQSSRATGADKTGLDRRIVDHLAQQAWFVPVVATGLPYYATTTVTGVATSVNAPLLSLYEVRPAG
ncbi:MAG TPA: ABC transporter substrate-binding protein [Pseudonocardiaceae bacterium]|nr:ABC transporter substrate-binding protein [Pseudonocardiaceae bacterium]